MDLYSEFFSLKNKWIEETKFVSNPSEIYGNRYYQSIIALGKDIVPILIEDLDTINSDWFYALNEITGINPIKEENYGKILKMSEDWKEYYVQNFSN